MPTLSHSQAQIAVEEAIERDPQAAEFLFFLLTSAAFSLDFKTLLDPVPVPSRYLSGNNLNIILLRNDLHLVPPLTDEYPVLTGVQTALLAAAIFRTDSTVPLLVSEHPKQRFPTIKENNRARVPIERFFLCRQSSQSKQATSARTPLLGFHAMPPDRWYSMLHQGSSIQSTVGFDAKNLARTRERARTSMPLQKSRGNVSGCRFVSASVVGEVEVCDTGAGNGADAQDGHFGRDVEVGRLWGVWALLEVGNLARWNESVSAWMSQNISVLW